MMMSSQRHPSEKEEFVRGFFCCFEGKLVAVSRLLITRKVKGKEDSEGRIEDKVYKKFLMIQEEAH